MRYLLLFGLYIVLAAYAVTDVLNRGKQEYFGLHRTAWIAIIILAPYLGALIWIGLQMRGRGGTSEPRQKAPDDDPDYLRWLRQQERRKNDD
ncbi:PLDc N-terminal domain-containing protein [Demequina sp. B12]|uniref:PLD nuclease N-terminal domain-containing protein n=1 Tax=Demequina sp. B12 TaxID=2992757 RepID=UPI00237AAC2A|nr:PLD nuclease N-terminal domain-containing protein [Demequina sp. B12]MDE0572333.1 PLDc N-terminal domain-containing protein [Demequina sp. B12]